jgi:hypothetical protein
MMFTSRLLPPLAVHIAPLCGSAQAAGFEVGTSIICDAQTQVGRFVALQADFDAVNAEEQNPTAWAFADVVYLPGAEIGMARDGDSAF